MTVTSRRIGPAHLMELGRQLRRDDAINDDELRRRDRRIGRALPPLPPGRRIVAWLEQVGDTARDAVGHRCDVAQRVATLLLILLGLALGWTSAMAVFHYDGSRPVNVVRALAIYVVIQLLLLLVSLLAIAPPRIVALLPGARTLTEAMRVVSPGRLAPWLVRLTPQDMRDAFAQLQGTITGQQRVFGRLQKWIVLHLAQWFAVAFNVGAIAGLLQLVVFSDLAFAWSTTLDVATDRFDAVCRALAAPWSWAFEQAAPSGELIETTRYSRAQPHVVSDPQGHRLGREWWPFLLASMIFYGLAPRIVTLVVTASRSRAVLRETILIVPGVAEVLDRMGAGTAAESEDDDAVDVAPVPMHKGAISRGRVINWSGFPAGDDVVARLGVGPVIHAGGGVVDRDAASLDEAARSEGVIVLVKAWEPPVLDLIDYLRDLRRAMGDGKPITVFAATVRGEALARADDRTVAQWRRALARAGDPWLDLAGPDAGTES